MCCIYIYIIILYIQLFVLYSFYTHLCCIYPVVCTVQFYAHVVCILQVVCTVQIVCAVYISSCLYCTVFIHIYAVYIQLFVLIMLIIFIQEHTHEYNYKQA